MNKIIGVIFAICFILSPAVNAADSGYRDNPSPYAGQGAAQVPDYAAADPGFAVVDILVMRPLGIAATVAGSALFAAISPFTAVASIPAPHNAFNTAYKVLIRIPARYTFVRPVGDKTLPGYDVRYGDEFAHQQRLQY
jgi:hypothetical protein